MTCQRTLYTVCYSTVSASHFIKIKKKLFVENYTTCNYIHSKYNFTLIIFFFYFGMFKNVFLFNLILVN